MNQVTIILKITETAVSVIFCKKVLHSVKKCDIIPIT